MTCESKIDHEAIKLDESAWLASSADERVGRELELRRADLYATSERAEVREFIEAVHLYWGRDNAPAARSA